MAGKSSQEPLFKSLTPDGKTVMLSVGQDGTWTLTHDGQAVAEGTGEPLSISAAVRKFRAMVRPPEKTTD